VRSLEASRKNRPENVRIHTLDEFMIRQTSSGALRAESKFPMTSAEAAVLPASDGTHAVFAHLNAEKSSLYRTIRQVFVAERARFTLATPTVSRVVLSATIEHGA
jgi:hypothetical protein